MKKVKGRKAIGASSPEAKAPRKERKPKDPQIQNAFLIQMLKRAINKEKKLNMWMGW